MDNEQTPAPDQFGNGEATVGTLDLESELAASKAKAEDNYNKFLLAMADFENYKKRIERQFAEIVISGKKSTIGKFLPVADNLERALQHKDNLEALHAGISQTLRVFENILASEGVKLIDVKDKLFDPKVAAAIGTQSREGIADDVVIEEAQHGYTIGDELLRPAQVIVNKHD